MVVITVMIMVMLTTTRMSVFTVVIVIIQHERNHDHAHEQYFCEQICSSSCSSFMGAAGAGTAGCRGNEALLKQVGEMVGKVGGKIPALGRDC